MKILECPFCKGKVTSYIKMGNSFYLLKNKKECGHCLKSVKLDLMSLMVFLFIIPIFGIGFPIFLGEYFSVFESSILYLVFIIGGSVALISGLYFLFGKIGMRLFLRKDN
jgi:hypothetical protein